MNWNGKRVLITGISGFVGPYLARHLLQLGATVYGFNRRRADGAVPSVLQYLRIAGEVILLEGDLLDITGLGSALDAAEPDFVFHLGSQSFVPRSFSAPQETLEVNVRGTANLLEAIRIKRITPRIVFAGSSEEYGLVITSSSQLRRIIARYGSVFPPATRLPELPVSESNPLRPMSPYAASKVMGDFLMQTFAASYGLDTVTSRAFNHEGAGRGTMFVTSAIVNQVMQLEYGERDSIVVGNVNAFRDWSHVEDVVGGYRILAEAGQRGEVYNQGSQRTNSVIGYVLLTLEASGYQVEAIETMRTGKRVTQPTEPNRMPFFGTAWEKTKVDQLLLEEEISFELQDEGIWAHTNKGKVPIRFDPCRFRPAEVPILLSDTTKIRGLGFTVKHSLTDIIRDQINYFLDPARRTPVV